MVLFCFFFFFLPVLLPYYATMNQERGSGDVKWENSSMVKYSIIRKDRKGMRL